MTSSSRSTTHARIRCGTALTLVAAGALVAPLAAALPAVADTGDLAVAGATAGPVVASDAFGRTATAGWGTADSGAAWTPNYQAASFSVSGGQGRVLTGTPGA